MDSPKPAYRHHSIPTDILDDLGSRFIINVPEDQRKDLIRICFQIELAHWFYIDEYVTDNAHGTEKLSSCSLREFAEHMFRHISFLRRHADNIETVLEEWKNYKLSVPTYGAIMLNEDLSQVLLVQGFWSKTSWGFPKGKVNEDEPPHLCAIREVHEETGFDISKIINPDLYLQTVINDQTQWLFLIPGVPTKTSFAPKTRNEIRDLQWFPLDDLPNRKTDAMRPNHLNIGPNNLYMVLPFVKSLKKWVATYKRGAFNSSLGGGGGRQRLKSENYERQQQQQPQSASKPKKKHSKSSSQQQQQQQQQPQHQQQIAKMSHQDFLNSAVSGAMFRPISQPQQQQQQQQKPKHKQKQQQQPLPVADAAAATSTPSTTTTGDGITLTIPKVWENFRFKKKEIITAMASSPGWL